LSRRVTAVVTGVGAVTALGVGANKLIDGWLEARCGLRDGLGSCDEFDPREHLTGKECRRTDRSTQLALAACDEAVRQAGWDVLRHDPVRVGCVIGTGIGGTASLERSQDTLRDRGSGAVSPLTVPLMMPNAPAANAAIRYNIRGEVLGVTTACAAGAHAIGTGLRMLAVGACDAVLVGGAEAALTPLSIAAFRNMQATSTLGLCRPFDARRDGFVLAEGAAALVLETPEAARARGAVALGEVIGYGASCDASHLTAPVANGSAAAGAITAALASADIGAERISYVNAHGTSTPLNDRAETAALKMALDAHASDVPVSSTKRW